MNYQQFLDLIDVPDSYYMRALYGQSALETGNFSSNIYLNHNNLFGMRPSQKRERFYQDIYNSPKNGKFAKYDSLAYSLLDRINLDEYNDIYKPQNDTEIEVYYLDVQKHGFAGKNNIVYAPRCQERYVTFFPYDYPLSSTLAMEVGKEYTNSNNNISLQEPEPKEGFNWLWLLLLLPLIPLVWRTFRGARG